MRAFVSWKPNKTIDHRYTTRPILTKYNSKRENDIAPLHLQL